MAASRLESLPSALAQPTSPTSQPHPAGSRRCRPGCGDWAAKRGLSVTEDRAGNLLVRPAARSRKRPIVAVAHMDHPALVVTRPGDGPRSSSEVGCIPSTWPSARLQIETSAGPKPARLEEFDPATNRGWLVGAVTDAAVGRHRALGISRRQSLGIEGDRLRARACDDLAGAAAALSRSRPAG